MKLGTLKDEEQQEKASTLRPSDVEETLGLQVQAITPEVAWTLRLENAEGVVVSQIAADGPAAEAARGDIIREINRRSVTDIDSYQEATAQLDPESPVLLLLERRGNGIYAAFKPRLAKKEKRDDRGGSSYQVLWPHCGNSGALI